MAELRDPKDYPKALCLVQSIDITLYVVAAVVIYCFAGQDVTSPALGSASVVVRKVAYGVALPTVSHSPKVKTNWNDANRMLDCYCRCCQWPCRLQASVSADIPQ